MYIIKLEILIVIKIIQYEKFFPLMVIFIKNKKFIKELILLLIIDYI